MTKVVHFDEVEVVFLVDQICLLIKPLKPILIHLLREIGGSVVADLFSMLVHHVFHWLLILAGCLRPGGLRGTKLKENVFCPVKCHQVPFHVRKCIWCMAVILGHQGEINHSANTLQGVLEIIMLGTVRIS